MFRLLWFFVAMVPAVVLSDVSFVECPNGAPTPILLKINDCTADECILVSGQPISAIVSGIYSPIDSNTAKAHISSFVGGLDTGFEISPELEDACSTGIDGGCPLTADVAFSYSLESNNLDVPARGVEVEVEIGLTGDGDVELTCLRFKAIVNE
ncbi:NPC intracellular cholesterol transporter 2-like [Malaya genurostris]|uniref:NPC intracellular cholesterol transporter 2-like n=1 Tax=Malaya genurostris TaxID=325434 RepID=UPI0026F3D3C8|nr:NPC intracellular cholesterol transporter 2-like [Malaya genurostris]